MTTDKPPSKPPSKPHSKPLSKSAAKRPKAGRTTGRSAGMSQSAFAGYGHQEPAAAKHAEKKEDGEPTADAE